MPKPTKHPAVAALGVGIDRDKWTLTAVVHRLETRYTALMVTTSHEQDAGHQARARLLSAQAAEIAQFLAGYYQDNSREPEDHKRWSHRADRASSFAFKRRNEIAENLHAGLNED